MGNSAVTDISLFESYMRLTGTPSLENEPGDDPELYGKRLGIVNGGSWISLWSTYFGRRFLPGVKLINVGNDAIQLNFMRAYHNGEPCPPEVNIELFSSYADQLVTLYGIDALLITCSTMNRSADRVRRTMKPYGVPVVQIDEPMMESAVARGGTILVVATHGPTVKSTHALLRETAEREGSQVSLAGVTVESAFDHLGRGEVGEHNDIIYRAIEESVSRESITTVVLAQLSMSLFALSYPDTERTLGVPVLTSGEEGFRRIRTVLKGGARNT